MAAISLLAKPYPGQKWEGVYKDDRCVVIYVCDVFNGAECCDYTQLCFLVKEVASV